MDSVVGLMNKWTASIAVGILYFWMNRLELLGQSSDPNIEPVQVLVVVALTFLACFAVEWAYRRRGFLPKLTVVPDNSVAAGTFAMEPNSWHD